MLFEHGGGMHLYRQHIDEEMFRFEILFVGTYGFLKCGNRNGVKNRLTLKNLLNVFRDACIYSKVPSRDTFPVIQHDRKIVFEETMQDLSESSKSDY